VSAEAGPATALEISATDGEAQANERAELAGPDGARAGARLADPSGVLRLCVLDGTTRAPVPDLEFVVYRERGGDRVLARGRTDAQGRAEVGGLEANVILVETARRPPFAPRTAGVWLLEGETKDLEILLDGGGAVRGRVVDDLGRPVPDARILLGSQPGQPPGLAGGFLELEGETARSGEDGHFEIGCLAMRPRGVWIVDGEMRPERWNGERVIAIKDRVTAETFADTRAGETVELADIVLPRATSYAGAVLDARGIVIEGALVSLRVERLHARLFGASGGGARNGGFLARPGQEGFRLHALEALTDAAGRFELSGAAMAWACVWTPDGPRQRFRLPEVAPGERRDGIELRLDPGVVLELELVDGSGEQIRAPAPAVAQPGVLTVFARIGGASRRTTVECRLTGGELLKQDVACDADGLWRPQIEAAASEIVEIAVRAPGYETVREALPGGLGGATRRRYVLEALPVLRGRLVSTGSAELLAEPGLSLQLQACSAPPARRADPRFGRELPTCCGYGSYMHRAWPGTTSSFVLPVRDSRPYWIHLRMPDESRRFVDVASFGPFEPGATEHEIALDPAELARRLVRDEPREPPPSSSGPEQPPQGELSAVIVDSTTRQGIGSADLHLERVGKVTHGAPSAQFEADEAGRIVRAKLGAGRWTATAHAAGYRRSVAGIVSITTGSPLDLGMIALAPLPSFRGRLLDASGAPLGKESLFDASAEGSLRANTGAQGQFEFLGDVTAPLLVQVGGVGAFTQRREHGQRVLVPSWPAHEVIEIRLAPWRRLEVHLVGPVAQRSESALYLFACPAPREATASCDHRLPLAGHQPLLQGRAGEAAPGARVFNFELAAGRYQLFGGDLIADLPWTEVTVAQASQPMVVEIASD